MNTLINLKELEKKAFRSFFQDGIWDIFFGLMMFAMYAFTLFDSMENRAVRILILIGIELGAAFLLIYGKKAITVPRLGNVVFGEKRKRRFIYIILANLASLFVLTGSLVLRLSRPDLLDNDLVSSLGLGIWIIFIMSLMAYFLDFNRLYIYGFVFGATFSAVLILDLPILFFFASLVMILPGVYLLVRFLQSEIPVRGE
jgi:hypothetical protein